MCLSTVYMISENEKKEVMKDIARIEAGDRGFWFINLFGEKQFLEGKIETVDLMDGHFVLVKNETST